MAGILLVILFVLIFLMSCQKKSVVKSKCTCKSVKPESHFTDIDDERIAVDKLDTKSHGGLREIEMTPVSRGMVPIQNQPNHIANLWKCDLSQSQANTMVCEEADTPVAFDFITPVRGKVVNMDVDEASNMQKISRFGSISS